MYPAYEQTTVTLESKRSLPETTKVGPVQTQDHTDSYS